MPVYYLIISEGEYILALLSHMSRHLKIHFHNLWGKKPISKIQKASNQPIPKIKMAMAMARWTVSES